MLLISLSVYVTLVSLAYVVANRWETRQLVVATIAVITVASAPPLILDLTSAMHMHSESNAIDMALAVLSIIESVLSPVLVWQWLKRWKQIPQ